MMSSAERPAQSGWSFERTSSLASSIPGQPSADRAAVMGRGAHRAASAERSRVSGTSYGGNADWILPAM